MAGTRLRKLGAGAVAALAMVALCPPALAHPMPDTEISFGRDAGGLLLVIRLPVEDLQLALPDGGLNDDASIDEGEERLLRAYFSDHIALLDRNARSAPARISTLRIVDSTHPDLGSYQELEVRVSAPAAMADDLTLVYDAIMHEVPNHRALVSSAGGEPIGIIRFSLADRRTNPLPLPAVNDSESMGETEKGALQEQRVTPYLVSLLLALVISGLGFFGWLFLRRTNKLSE